MAPHCGEAEWDHGSSVLTLPCHLPGTMMWAAGLLPRPSTHASCGTVAHAALGESPPPQWQELLVPGEHTVQARTMPSAGGLHFLGLDLALEFPTTHADVSAYSPKWEQSGLLS